MMTMPPIHIALPSDENYVPAVSVIVPVFNAARYLPESLPLLLEGQEGACEVIAVDDASTDNSLEILRQYARKHPLLRVEALPANRGVSAARNRGLDLARGRYVQFVDADDHLHRGAVSRLLQASAGRQPDIILFRHRNLAGEKKSPSAPVVSHVSFYDLTDPLQIHPAFDTIAGNLMAWNGFFRRQALGDLRFRPYPNGEDVLFGVQAFCRAQTLMILPDVLYDYVQHPGTASRAKSARHCMSTIDVAREMVSSLQATPFHGAVKDLVFRKIRCMTHGLALTVLLAVPKTDRQRCWNYWFDHLGPVFLCADLVPLRQRWIYRLAFRTRSRWLALLLLRLPIQVKGWLLSFSAIRQYWMRVRHRVQARHMANHHS